MITQKEIELCQEITGLALRINAQGRYSVWAELHGHVHSFEVRITKGWQPNIHHLAGWGGMGCGSCAYLSSTPETNRYGVSHEEYLSGAIDKLIYIRDGLAAFLEPESV